MFNGLTSSPYFWLAILLIITLIPTFFERTLKSSRKKHLAFLIGKREGREHRLMHTIEEIRALSPIAFEHYIKSLFERMGYRVETTRKSGDEGVDLILRNKRGTLSIVQCKRFRYTVGAPIVRDLYGAMIHTGAQEAFLVTTGLITLPARQWAVGKNIHLVDRSMLLEWIDQFRTDKTQQKERQTAVSRVPVDRTQQKIPQVSIKGKQEPPVWKILLFSLVISFLVLVCGFLLIGYLSTTNRL